MALTLSLFDKLGQNVVGHSPIGAKRTAMLSIILKSTCLREPSHKRSFIEPIDTILNEFVRPKAALAKFSVIHKTRRTNERIITTNTE